MALAGTMRCVTGDEQWLSEGAGGTLMLGAEGHPSSDRPCAQPGSHSQAPRGCGAIGDHVKDHPNPHVLVAFPRGNGVW